MEKLSNKEIEIKFYKYHPEYTLIRIIREKIKNRNRIMVYYKCDIGHVCKAYYENILKTNCCECRKSKVSIKNTRFTEKDIKERCKNKNLRWLNPQDYHNLQLNTSQRNKIRVSCINCNEESTINVTKLFSETKCPSCVSSGGNKKRSFDEFKNRFYKKYKESDYKISGEYIDCKTPIELTCKRCNKVIFITPDVLINKDIIRLCSVCDPRFKGEKCIEELLIQYGIPYKMQYSFDDLIGDKRKLRFDFAVFKNKELILLEYDGELHYMRSRYYKNNLEKQKEYDLKKDKYCKLNKIKLIRIPFWDFDNIEYIMNREGVI